MNAEDAFFQSQDAKLFFASGPASMALTQLERGLEDASPVIVLTGEPGVGKTTVVREAIARWGDRVHAVWFEVEVGPPEKTLLKTIRAFGGHGRAKDERPELIARMAHALNGITERGSTPLLIVDDAHDYAIHMLAEVGRIESAAMAADQNLKLLLVGEPRLTDLLDREELDIISQRLAVSCRLEPMEQADTRQYLNHRVGATGDEASNAFSRKAAREVHAITRGVPSAINSLAAEALRRANATNAGVVTPDHVRAVMAAARRVAGTTSPYEPASPPEPRIRPLPVTPSAVTPKPNASAPPSMPQRPASQTPPGQQSRPVAPGAPGVQPAPRPAPPMAPRSAKPNTPGGPRQAEPVPPKVKRVPPPPPPAAPVSTEPAVDLDSSHPRVKEWVSRFTDGQPLRIGGGQPPQPITDPSTLPDPKPIFADDDELLVSPAEVPATPAPQAPPLDELLNPTVAAGQPPVAAAPPAPPVPDPHAVELLKDEPLISAEALTPPPLVLDEKPAEATPSGSMKRPAAAAPTPPGGTPKPLIATPKPAPRSSGSMARPKLPPSVSSAPAPGPATVPTSAKGAPNAKPTPSAAMPKPAQVAAAPIETPAVLTKKDVKAHKPDDRQKIATTPPRQPDAATAIEDDEFNLPSPTVYRVLAALIPIVLILGMAATAIVLSRRSAFDREPESTDVASTPSAVSESVQAVPSAPLAPAPPPLVVTPDSEVTPGIGSTPDSEVPPAPVEQARFCLSVGTYLFSDRARQRTEQLSRRTHMKSWIITTTADGSYTYRVMLGGFATRAEAERMADKLLSNGLVSEAMVEPLPPQ